MDIGVDLNGMVKTNTKGLCKEIIDNITKYWPGSFYLLLRSKPMVPGGRTIIDIGYKYNVREIISFIVTVNLVSTKAGLNYLSNYPDHFLIKPFTLLHVPLSCISSLDQSTSLTPTTNQVSLIWCCISSGIISVVVYCYAQHFIWG